MEVSRHNTDSIDEASETLFHSRRRCFYLPCFERPPKSSESPSAGSTWWQNIRAPDAAKKSSIWSRGVGALMKIREWSEIVAGPRWKTFIRRFSRNRSGNANKHVNFQYDPLSYAMNFDEGQSGNLEEEEDGFYAARNFSSRYANGSMDLGKDGPTFV